MSDTYYDSYEQFLEPDILRPRLISISVYIAAFEMLKISIVDRIKEFLVSPVDGDDSEYRRDVLPRHKNLVFASLDWLKEHGAIDEGDITCFRILRDRRNQLAHQLFEIVVQKFPADLNERFGEIASLLLKVERFWVRWMGIDADAYYDDKEVRDEDIMPGPYLGLQMLTTVALGSPDESRAFLHALSELRASKKSAN